MLHFKSKFKLKFFNLCLFALFIHELGPEDRILTINLG